MKSVLGPKLFERYDSAREFIMKISQEIWSHT